MRKFLGLGAAVLLCAALAVGAAQAGPNRHSVVNLTFSTYVWQPTTVAANKNIVSAWNKPATRTSRCRSCPSTRTRSTTSC